MPRDATAEPRAWRAAASGEHERRLALGAIAEQISQVVATLSGLAAITVLARRMPLAELGTYGLLLSLTTYLVFVQGSIGTAAIKALAEAMDQRARDRAFSTAVALYVVAALVAGVVLAAAGMVVLGLFDAPARFHHDAQASVLALSALTVVSWPLRIFQDVLRGNQSFVAAATADGVASIVVGAALIALAVAGAALWLLVATGASIPLIAGAISSIIVLAKRLPYRYRRSDVSIHSIRAFLGLSTYLVIGGIADLVIYSLDRAVLATFRSAAAVGLYEGPIRTHNLIQQVHTTLATPVVPASARYIAEHDIQRTRDLLLRGTRYTLAAVVPLSIALMVLAKPLLEVWLGPKFAVAATAMILLAGYWLINGNTGVSGRMLIAAGRARAVAVYASAVAAMNLAISIALTPSLGLNGVVLGTVIAYLLGFPFFVRITLATFPVHIRDFARDVWVPAYTTGAVVGVALLLVRLAVSLDSLAKVASAGLLTVVSYWAIYYVAWLRPNERLLVKTVFKAAVRR